MKHRWRNPVCHFGTRRAESAESGVIWAPSQRVGSKSIDLMDEASQVVRQVKALQELSPGHPQAIPPEVVPIHLRWDSKAIACG